MRVWLAGLRSGLHRMHVQKSKQTARPIGSKAVSGLNLRLWSVDIEVVGNIRLEARRGFPIQTLFRG